MTSFVQGRQLTLMLSGEIDHHGASILMRWCGEKIAEYLPKTCILDFRDVTFMDSSGIAVVIQTHRRMRELNGEVILRDIPAQSWKVLHAAGIERIAKIERSVPV